MDENKVYIEFVCESGAKVSIVIQNARDNIMSNDIIDVANDIVNSGLFAVNRGEGQLDYFSYLNCAYYLRTSKQPLEPKDPENRKAGVR